MKNRLGQQNILEKIALCDKWNEQIYGVNTAESSNIKLVEYLKTKYLVHYTFDSYEEYNIEYIYNETNL